MDTHAWSALAAAGIAVAAGTPYIIATARGAIRPNRATWLVYLVVGVIGSVGMWSAGARAALAVPLAYAAIAAVVTVLAISKGEGGWSPLDRACLGTATLSLALWAWLGDARIAVVLPALADLAGTVPTIVKAWRNPAGEHRWAWTLFMIASLTGCLSVPAFDVANLFYPACILLGTMAVSLGLWWPRTHSVVRVQS